jgi:hypothetical protein
MNSISPLFPFEHRKILKTAMPLGGIGTDCIYPIILICL